MKAEPTTIDVLAAALVAQANQDGTHLYRLARRDPYRFALFRWWGFSAVMGPWLGAQEPGIC